MKKEGKIYVCRNFSVLARLNPKGEDGNGGYHISIEYIEDLEGTLALHEEYGDKLIYGPPEEIRPLEATQIYVMGKGGNGWRVLI